MRTLRVEEEDDEEDLKNMSLLPVGLLFLRWQSEERAKETVATDKVQGGASRLREEGVVVARVVEENRLEGGEESRLGRDCYRRYEDRAVAETIGSCVRVGEEGALEARAVEEESRMDGGGGE